MRRNLEAFLLIALPYGEGGNPSDSELEYSDSCQRRAFPSDDTNPFQADLLDTEAPDMRSRSSFRQARLRREGLPHIVRLRCLWSTKHVALPPGAPELNEYIPLFGCLNALGNDINF